MTKKINEKAIQDAKTRLTRNGVKIAEHTKVINLNGYQPGNKVWGAIDCLCNYAGYRVAK